MLQIAQMQQQTRQQGMREQQSGQHFGMSGGNINPQTGREAGNPFDTGFFQSGAASLNPQQIAQSQHGGAVNMWNNPGMFPGHGPSPMSQAEGAAGASPAPFQISPESSALVHGYKPQMDPYAAGPMRKAMPMNPRQGKSFGFSM